MRRTCERPTSIPSSCAAAARESSVHSAGPDSSKAHSSPTGSHRSRPGGTVLTREMIRDRSCSVIRLLQPCPPRSSSPSRPAPLKRCSPQRTVFWLQPSSAAIAGTRCPDQLNPIIRARITTSRGAFRARASRRTTARSSPSRSGRAHKTIAQHPPPSTRNYPATRTYTQPKRNPALKPVRWITRVRPALPCSWSWVVVI